MKQEVYVLTLQWQADYNQFAFGTLGVFSTRELAIARLAEYVRSQDTWWTNDLYESWEQMTDQEQIDAYFDFWSDDHYRIDLRVLDDNGRDEG